MNRKKSVDLCREKVSIIVAGILVVIVITAILFGMRKDRKSGKGSCAVTAANVRVVIKSSYV